MSRAGRVYGKRETGDATEACRIVRVGRAARVGAMATAPRPGEESSVSFPPKRPVNPLDSVRWASCEPLGVNSRQIRISMSCLLRRPWRAIRTQTFRSKVYN